MGKLENEEMRKLANGGKGSVAENAMFLGFRCE